jgi:hypothetical protein
MLYGKETMVNLSKVHRIVLDRSMVHLVYGTPEIQTSFFSENKMSYTYCFNSDFRARKVYEDIQITLAKNGKLADIDGMLK